MPPAQPQSARRRRVPILPTAVRDNLHTLIFDLDGVITSEETYWQTGRLTLAHMMSDPNLLGLPEYVPVSADGPEYAELLPLRTIHTIKRRAVNSNWDSTYLACLAHLLTVMESARIDAPLSISAERSSAITMLHELGQRIPKTVAQAPDGIRRIQRMLGLFKVQRGAELLDACAEYTAQHCGLPIEILVYRGPLWQFCHDQFQHIHMARIDEPENLTDDPTQLTAVLERLSTRFTLGIATGRPRDEALAPLRHTGLLKFFDPKRISTWDDVTSAEVWVKTTPTGHIHLSKPHPFPVLRAIYPEHAFQDLVHSAPSTLHPSYAMIGDTASDLYAAKSAGCLPIGILGQGSAAQLAEKRRVFQAAGCETILHSVSDLPYTLGLNGY